MSKKKVITTQFKLIEMSQNRARVHTQRSKRYVLWETKLPFIVHVHASVSESQDKWDKISVIHSILTLGFRLYL